MARKSLKDTVHELLNEGNAETLKPGSGPKDEIKKLETEVDDTGAAIDDVASEKKDFTKSVSKSKEPGPNQNIKEEDEKDPEDEDEPGPDDDGEDKEKSVKETYEFKIDVKEDMDALFHGSDLSEDFKSNATNLFETAIKSKLKLYKEELDKEYDSAIAEAVSQITVHMDTKVEKYLNYVAEGYMAENEVAIENSLRTELTEDFISGLRNLFLENYIDVPEEKVNVLEGLSNKVNELEDRLNEEIKHNIELSETINESKKQLAIASLTEGLTATQSEKIRRLAEEVEYVSDSDYTKKVQTLKESYFPTNTIKKDNSMLVEVSDNPNETIVEENLTGRMAQYAKTLGKFTPN